MGRDQTSVVAEVSGDHALLEAARSGDSHAFVSLVRKYQVSVTQLARFYGAAEAGITETEVSEIAKRTWQSLLEEPKSSDRETTLKTQLYRIVLHQTAGRRGIDSSPPFAATVRLIDDAYEGAVNRNRFRSASDTIAPLHWLARPAGWHLPASNHPADTEAFLSVIERALDDLSPAQHEVILLRDVLGWATDEVGDALSISDAMQRSLLHRARASVRNRIEEHLTA